MSADKLSRTVCILLIAGAILTFIVAFDVMVAFRLLSTDKEYAPVEGKIEVRDGTPLSNVTVYIEGENIKTKSNTSGYYHLENVPTGQQTVVYKVHGYSTLRIKTFVMSQRYAYKLFNQRSNIFDIVPEYGYYIYGPYIVWRNWELPKVKANVTFLSDRNINVTVYDVITNNTVHSFIITSNIPVTIELNASLYRLVFTNATERSLMFALGHEDRTINLNEFISETFNVHIKLEDNSINSMDDVYVQIFKYNTSNLTAWQHAINNSTIDPTMTIAIGSNKTIALNEGYYVFKLICDGCEDVCYGPMLIYNDTILTFDIGNLTPIITYTLAESKDFHLCSAMLVILAFVQFIGAVNVLKFRGQGPITFIGILASASNFLSPYLINQVIAVVALMLFFVLIRVKGKRGDYG